jgi:hypothetical protein
MDGQRKLLGLFPEKPDGPGEEEGGHHGKPGLDRGLGFHRVPLIPVIKQVW